MAGILATTSTVDISGVISQVGFPIAMCLLLFYQMIKQDKEHEEQSSKLRDCLENNTLAITKLIDKLEGKENAQ